MSENLPPDRAVSELMASMIARVTHRAPADPITYRRARRRVLKDPQTGALAPDCLRACPEIQDVWRYVKSREPPLSTYAARRRYLREQFAPLLELDRTTTPVRYGSTPRRTR
ncbi:MAG TPA: hypothetical protein VMB51_12140 [Solirubrobacteraceae bacterium]|nr:hypothetical protein [Solirubrobacteraceae bacterium]